MKLINPCALLSFLILAGCANVQTGKDFDATKASGFQKGKATKADVIASMGQPDNAGGNGDSSYIEYRYSVVKTSSNPLTAIIGMNNVSTDDKLKQCRFNFDHNDRLKDYTCQEGTPDYSGFGK